MNQIPEKKKQRKDIVDKTTEDVAKEKVECFFEILKLLREDRFKQEEMEKIRREKERHIRSFRFKLIKFLKHIFKMPQKV